jgi:hypothetical protein
MSNARSAATKAGPRAEPSRGEASRGETGSPPAAAAGAPRLKVAVHPAAAHRPTAAQRGWLVRGLDQPGGKLPLFDRNGQRIDPRTIRSCIEQGWAEPWFSNPLKPDWLVCKLTEAGRLTVEGH